MSLNFASVVKRNNIGPYDYSILILGASGSGKSTLLNTIVNSVLDSKIDNLTTAIRCSKYPTFSLGFDDEIEERIDSESCASQTKSAHFYKISGSITNYKKILLVDTPGIYSTEGLVDDEENILEIIRAARLIKHFNAIFFVQPFSENRLTEIFLYKMSRISEVIPRDFEKSVLLINAFSDFISKSDLKHPFQIKKEFDINNPFFKFSQSDYINSDKLKNKMEKKLRKSYKEIGKIFDFVFQMNANANTQYNDLFRYHNNIMCKISEFNIHLQNIESIKGYLENKTEIISTRLVRTNYHNTVCSKCNVVCHENCNLDFTYSKNSKYFNNCACMNLNDICKICSCESDTHAHRYDKPITGTITIKEILKEYEISDRINNEDEIKSLINQKEQKIIKELIEQESLIVKVNPRYTINEQLLISLKCMGKGLIKVSPSMNEKDFITELNNRAKLFESISKFK